MTRQEDVAWAAGLFEGEGCLHVSWREKGNKLSLQADVTMGDRDVVERFAAIMGFGAVREARRKGRPHWKTMYSWHVGAAEDVRRVISLLGPWLGARRLEKAAEVWAYAEYVVEVKARRLEECRHGHAATDENTLVENGVRRCRPCRRLQLRAADQRYRRKKVIA